MRVKGSYVIVFLFAIIWSWQCSQDSNPPDSIQGSMSLKLVNGNPLSTPEADEYNPMPVLLPDGKIALFFGSDRAFNGIKHHRIWVAVTDRPLENPTNIPPFQFPMPIRYTSAGTPVEISSNTRISFAAYPLVDPGSNSMQIVLTFADNQNTLYDVFFAPSEVFSGTSSQDKISTGGYGQIVGFRDNGPDGIAFVLDKQGRFSMVSRSMGNTSEIPFGKGLPLSKESWLSSFALLPPDAFFATFFDPNGFGGDLLGTRKDVILGGVEGLNIPLHEKNLMITYHNHLPTPFGVAMVFSAGSSYYAPQDLYVVTSHDSFELWNMIKQQQFNQFAAEAGPENIPGLEAWYSGDGIYQNPLNTFLDFSGNGRDLMGSTITGGALPLWTQNSVTGWPTIQLDGTGYFTYNGNIQVGQVYVVARYQDATNTFAGPAPLVSVVSANTGMNQDILVGTSGTTISGANVSQNNYASAASAGSVTGMALNLPTLFSTYHPTPVDANALYIGYNNIGTPALWKGEIYEILIYNRQLDPAEDQLVVDYLLDKYGISRQGPTAISTAPTLWLRADSRVENTAGSFNQVGSAVTVGWHNLMGADTFTPSGSPSPVLQQGNIGPWQSIAFSASNSNSFSNSTMVAGSSSGAMSDMTLFIVFKGNSFTGNHVLFSSRNGAIGSTASSLGLHLFVGPNVSSQPVIRVDCAGGVSFKGTTVLNVGQPYIVSEVIHMASTPYRNDLYINGQLEVSPTTYTGNTGIRIGATNETIPTSFFDGDIAEVIMYNSTLTDIERQNIECYLSKRYGIPLIGVSCP